jgi:RNA polymerase sigma-70 factor (ECF subfamily)
VVSQPRKPFPLRVVHDSGERSAKRLDPVASEAELIEGVIRGDERVAVELYHRLLPAIESSLLRVLGRRETDHEDLVQTSFEQLILTLSRQRFAGACSLATWASSIAAHVALKSIRSRTRQRRVFNHHVEPQEVSERQRSSDDVEGALVSRQRLEQVRLALAELAPPKAEAVLLHDVLGHGLTEIAALTGSTVAAAQTRLSRGRRELAERLERIGALEGES